MYWWYMSSWWIVLTLFYIFLLVIVYKEDDGRWRIENKGMRDHVHAGPLSLSSISLVFVSCVPFSLPFFFTLSNSPIAILRHCAALDDAERRVLIVSPPSIYRDSTRYCCCVFSSLFRLSLFYYYYIERNMKFRHNWIIPPLNLRFSVAVSFFLLTLNRRLIERRSQTIETTFKYTNRVTFIFFLFVVFTHTNNNNNSSFSMILAFGFSQLSSVVFSQLPSLAEYHQK